MNIQKILPGVKKNILLRNYTTFRIGGRTKYFFAARTKEDLIKAILVAKKIKLPFFILSGGSNVLVSDKGYKGLVINFQFSIFNFQNNKIITGAGTPLGKLVITSAERELTGLEWGIGIPGTVGGAICGNAGAFRKSIADITKEVEVFKFMEVRLPKITTLKNRDCKFDYRDSIFKHNKNLIILSATLQLKKGNKKVIKNKIKKNLEQRRKTQPLNFPSAGSVFKNPPLILVRGKSQKFSAGELIEKCGLKGKKIGDAQISQTHANFIVNLGKAKAKDVIKLIKLIKKEIKNKFNIELEEEIQYLGFKK